VNRSGWILHSFYGHITPFDNLPVGCYVKDDVIGTINTLKENGRKCPAHLHLSLAWVAQAFSLADFTWEQFNQENHFQLLDPMLFI